MSNIKLDRDPPTASNRIVGIVGTVGILLGGAIASISVAQPLFPALIAIVTAALFFFGKDFDRTVLGLLVIRSSLDVFSEYQAPSAFAMGMILVAIVYLIGRTISRQKIYVDGFWWFFLGWAVLQGLWVILLPLGGLGLDGSFFGSAFREWLRTFSWVMGYLLVMQLKERLSPQQVATALFLSLVAPISAAFLQVLVPPSMLPSFLVYESGYSIEAGSRMNGTLGHPNTFATFVLMFLVLTLWRVGHVNRKLPWLILLGVLAFFLVSSKSLTGLIMLATFVPAFLVPKLNLPNLIGGVVLCGLVMGLFFSSDLGRERLDSLYGTPLLNPDIDWSRAVLLQWTDGNSFNWRIAQWVYLLRDWQDRPLLGYGLGTSGHLSIFETLPHNDYVRFLVEQGTVGFTSFVLFIGAQFARLLQLAHSAASGSPQRNLCFVMVAFLIAMLAGMISGNLWNHTTMLFYWWTLMAIAGWDWTPSPPTTEIQSPFSQPAIDRESIE